MKKILIGLLLLGVLVLVGWFQLSRPEISEQTVKLYFVSLNSEEPGESIGCGDSLIAVNREIPKTITPLKDTLNLLLSEKRQNIGESGLYNSLYQSNLKVDRIDLVSGVAKIYLTGTYQMGGVCDTPRFEWQLKKTALQFPTVKEAIFYLNGTLLTTSEKGE